MIYEREIQRDATRWERERGGGGRGMDESSSVAKRLQIAEPLYMMCRHNHIQNKTQLPPLFIPSQWQYNNGYKKLKRKFLSPIIHKCCYSWLLLCLIRYSMSSLYVYNSLTVLFYYLSLCFYACCLAIAKRCF